MALLGSECYGDRFPYRSGALMTSIDALAAAGPAAGDAFQELLARMVELLNDKLGAGQRAQLAEAMPRIHWEFPDTASALHLVAEAEALRIDEPAVTQAFFIRMKRATLEDAAFGRRSLTTAFLAGQIHVRGMNPLRLREFIMLVDPLLESYREAHDDVPSAATPAAS